MLGILQNLEPRSNYYLLQRSSSKKKMAVRLRLKKSNQSSYDASSTSGPICLTLRQQNFKLQDNVRNITRLQQNNAVNILQNCLSSFALHYKNQASIRNKDFADFVSKVKLILKNIYSQAELIAKLSQQKVDKQKQTVKYAQNDKKQPKILKNQSQNVKTKQFDYKIICEANNQDLVTLNNELRSQLAQMQRYIISLKQKISEKDQTITGLQLKQIQHLKQLQQLTQKAHARQIQFKVLKEQCQGYQQKIELLETKISILTNQTLNVGKVKNLIQQNGAKTEQITQPIGNNQEQNRQKLIQIYEKAEQTIRKYKKLEVEKEQKSHQCNSLTDKINSILNIIGQSDSTDPVAAIKLFVDQKEEEYRDRENKFQSMISAKLDETIQLASPMGLSKSEVSIDEKDLTILDKLAYLHHFVQYALELSPQSISNPNLGLLLILSNRLQKIMDKSQDFKSDLTQNNKILNQICERLQSQQSGDEQNRSRKASKSDNNHENSSKLNVSPKVLAKLEQLEQLLQQNRQELEGDESNNNMDYILQQQNQKSRSKSSSGRIHKQVKNSSNVQQYLGELENVIQQIQSNHNDQKIMNKTMYELEQRKSSRMRQQNYQIIKLVNMTVQKLQTVVQRTQLLNLQQIQEEIYSIVLQLRAIITSQQINQSSPNKQINRSNIRSANKYFPNSPQFVDAIVDKLVELNRTNDETAVLLIMEQIFNQIQNREDRIKQEMGRKKQIMKQRTAAIAQICSKGMKDSSQEISLPSINKQ